MNALGASATTISETERTHTRIRDVLSEVHGALNELANTLQPVLKPELANPVEEEMEIPPSTARHAELQSYAASLTELRSKLIALNGRIEV